MSAIDKYVSLLKGFVSGEISAPRFEASYLTLFKGESEALPEDVYSALNLLFEDVDRYCSDPAIRSEEDLDDLGLLESARKALEKIV